LSIFNIKHSTFINNQAFGTGSAVYVITENDSGNISNSLFSNNIWGYGDGRAHCRHLTQGESNIIFTAFPEMLQENECPAEVKSGSFGWKPNLNGFHLYYEPESKLDNPTGCAHKNLLNQDSQLCYGAL
jgi:predicted outer membrane repeat protein